jgi:hypothetical protein
VLPRIKLLCRQFCIFFGPIDDGLGLFIFKPDGAGLVLEYSGLLEVPMNTAYRVEVAGSEFAVIDPWGQQVNTYATEELAKQDIERCKSEDLLYETAQQLVDLSVKTVMKMHSIDRQTALYWIRSATETTD